MTSQDDLGRETIHESEIDGWKFQKGDSVRWKKDDAEGVDTITARHPTPASRMYRLGDKLFFEHELSKPVGP